MPARAVLRAGSKRATRPVLHPLRRRVGRMFLRIGLVALLAPAALLLIYRSRP